MLLKSLAALAGMGAGAVLSLQVVAAPLSPAPDIASGMSNPLVQPVHGCHRDVQLGGAGWHYHVGPGCRRVAASPRPRHRPYCWQDCTYIGPIKTCKTRCRGDDPY